MIGILVDQIIGPFWPYIAGAVVLVAGWFTAKRQGAQGAKAKSDRVALDKTLKGQEAARKGRAEASADLAKGKTPEEIVRGNDDAWN